MQNSTCSSTAITAISTPQRAARQAGRHAEQAEQVGQRPGSGGRGGQQSHGQRAGPQRVERQRGRVERAVQAEYEDRQDQPAEREHGEDDRGHVHRRGLAAEQGQDGQSKFGSIFGVDVVMAVLFLRKSQIY